MKSFRKKVLLSAISACLLQAATTSMAAEASSETSEANLESAIQKINAQTAQLQREVKMLKAELRKTQAKQPATVSETAPAASDATTFGSVPKLKASPIINISLPKTSSDLDPSAFLSYQTSMAQGLFNLQQFQALEAQLPPGQSLASADRTQIMLGGKIEGQASWQSPYEGRHSSSLDLITAELDVLAQASPWVSGVMIIDYNNASLNQVLLGSGNPVNNSQFQLNRGYLTLGNLNKSPIYFNIGQMYAPFGSYSTWMLTNPTTKVLGRTNTRAAELGFYKNGFNTSIYAFDGAADIGSDSQINNWGADASYNFNVGQWGINLGAGYINNISSAQGAQLTGGSQGSFQGFSQDGSTEILAHYVPGVDFNASVSKGPWYLTGETVAAIRTYDASDMTFNGTGAAPKAAHLETGIDFNVFGKKSVFSLSYDQTWQALAMGLPKNSYTASFNTSIWKNTVETLEFRHDVNYASTDTATGACNFAANGQVFTVCSGPAGGGSQNTLLAQIGLYF